LVEQIPLKDKVLGSAPEAHPPWEEIPSGPKGAG